MTAHSDRPPPDYSEKKGEENSERRSERWNGIRIQHYGNVRIKIVWVVSVEGSIIVTIRVIRTAGFFIEVIDTIAVCVVATGIADRHTWDRSRVVILRIRKSYVWGMPWRHG